MKLIVLLQQLRLFYSSKILFGSFLFCFFIHVDAQTSSIYIADGEKVVLFSEDSTSLFEDVTIAGKFETNVNSDLLFFGQNWTNLDSAKFPGNGRFTFQQPSSLGQDAKQFLGGSTETSKFPNIILRNKNDLELTGFAGNRDTFTFDTGHVIHAKQNFAIGNNNAGVILGYNENKFFVTNHDNTSDSGFLIRESVDSTAIDFPVGNGLSDYTPARIVNNGTADTFKVRVFNNVYTKGDSGQIVNDISVNRTWNILESTPGGSSVVLTLQHNAASEGSSYNRYNQYVARYYGQSNNAYLDTSNGSFWDYAETLNAYSNSAGDITTGSNTGYMSTRSLPITSSFSSNSPTRYFTKASSVDPLPVELLYLTASWQDRNSSIIKWSTASELNNKEFVVYRSYDNVTYDEVYTQHSLADNGTSNSVLNYEFTDYGLDPNRNDIYYRLVQIDYDNSVAEYGPVMLSRQSEDEMVVKAYPNPTQNKFNLTISGNSKGAFNYALIDVYGVEAERGRLDKSTFTETVVVDVSSLRVGHYWCKIQGENKNVITKPIHIVIAR